MTPTRDSVASLLLAVADSLNGSAPTAAAVRKEFGRARRNARIKDQFDGANYAAIAVGFGFRGEHDNEPAQPGWVWSDLKIELEPATG